MAGAAAFAAGLNPAPARATAWTFGVISDTQWVVADDGLNPESTAVDIVANVDKEMIRRGVKLVVAVGDTVDTSTPATLATRSLFAQDLYNAGIGFYPLRGNHESYMIASGSNTSFLYPQTVNGGVNNTPTGISPLYITTNLWNLPQAESPDTSFQTVSQYLAQMTTGGNAPTADSGHGTFTIGTNFSYPASNGTFGFGTNATGATITGTASSTQNGNGGLSYSFDYNNTRFILVDQFVDNDLGGNTSSTPAQLPWITGLVSGSAGTARPLQAFFFSHKNLLGGNHKDNIFGGNLSNDPGDGYGATYTGNNLAIMQAKQANEETFITSLYNAGVHYCISGHDHHHADSLVKSPLSTSRVHQLITQSDSAKFYTPASPFSANETTFSEDLYELGYYIFSVDGPRVTYDYYAVPSNANGSNISTTPVLTGNWVKMLTNGYSSNGQEFTVAEGNSYTGIADNTNNAIANATAFGESGFVGTSMAFLGGSNTDTLTTRDGRKLTKDVNTGWTPQSSDTTGVVTSDILTLWGMTDLLAIQTNTVAISISVPAGYSGPLNASICLGARDRLTNTWVNAVDYNIVGGAKTFVAGPYNSSYGLGCYGVDTTTTPATVWAVVNGDARDYAVINTPTAPVPWAIAGVAGHVGTADMLLLSKNLGSTNLAKYDLNGDGKVDASDVRWLTSHYTNPGGH